MLSKARHYILSHEIPSIYHALFSSNLNYGCQVWGLNSNFLLDKLDRLQKSAMRIMTFSGFRDHANPILKDFKILKIRDQIKLLNILFVHDWWNNRLPSCFDNAFLAREDVHSHATRAALSGEITIPKFCSIKYGKQSVGYAARVE